MGTQMTVLDLMVFLLSRLLNTFYFLFKNNEKVRFLITSFLLMAPISAALSWQDYSITRSYLMIIPILLLASYGIYHLIHEIHGKNLKLSLIVAVLMIYAFFQYYSWDNYFFHYQNKPQAISAWQCGYKELSAYIKKTYDQTDRYTLLKK